MLSHRALYQTYASSFTRPLLRSFLQTFESWRGLAMRPTFPPNPRRFDRSCMHRSSAVSCLAKYRPAESQRAQSVANLLHGFSNLRCSWVATVAPTEVRTVLLKTTLFLLRRGGDTPLLRKEQQRLLPGRGILCRAWASEFASGSNVFWQRVEGATA